MLAARQSPPARVKWPLLGVLVGVLAGQGCSGSPERADSAPPWSGKLARSLKAKGVHAYRVSTGTSVGEALGLRYECRRHSLCLVELPTGRDFAQDGSRG
jgi:hypothetical protein